MSRPTLQSLVADLSGGLVFSGAPPLGVVAVSGVHISELDDPGPYLAGGELLLTTGLLLKPEPTVTELYVHRLLSAGVAALGLGLGPVHDLVPAALRAACDSVGLPLLEVPEPVPFQAVTSAYWQARGRDDRREVVEAMDSQARVVRAAASSEPAELIRVLATAISGWAAMLRTDGSVVEVRPHSARGDAEALWPVLERLVVRERRAAAAVPTGDGAAIVSALRGGGYLVAAARRPFGRASRTLVSTTALLVELERARSDRRADAGVLVARLLVRGEDRAALALADEAGVELEGAHRVAALDGDPERVRTVLESLGEPVLEPRGGWVLLSGRGSVARLREVVTGAGVAAAVGAPTPLMRVPEELDRLRTLARAVGPGVLRVSGRGDRADPRDLLESAIGEDPDQRATVAAYLRQRGSVSGAARELGVHRNTVSARLRRVRADLADPDVSAELWLALRSLGLA